MNKLFRFDDSTAPSDPGLGAIRFNAKDTKDVTLVFIDTVDENNAALTPLLGELHIKSLEEGFEALFDVVEVTDKGGYNILKVELIAAEGWPKPYSLLTLDQPFVYSTTQETAVPFVTVVEETAVPVAPVVQETAVPVAPVVQETAVPEKTYFLPLVDIEEPKKPKEEIEVANFNAKPGQIHLCDTTAASFQGVLPPLPKDGDSITFVKVKNSWATNPFKINRNGNTIQNLPNNLICQGDKTTITLQFSSKESSWILSQK